MRALIWIVAGLNLAGVVGASPADQPDIVKKLNERLAASCYNRPVLQVSASGVVARRDADGGTMTFALSDIGSVTIDADAQAHVLLSCKADTPCIVRTVASGTSTIRLAAFSIDGLDQGEAVRQLFEDLRKSFAQPAKIADGVTACSSWRPSKRTASGTSCHVPDRCRGDASSASAAFVNVARSEGNAPLHAASRAQSPKSAESASSNFVGPSAY
jgi:hypothetical protein